jgi:hypothetical protein
VSLLGSDPLSEESYIILRFIIGLYIGVLRSLWLFLIPISPFAAQRKEFFFDGLKKLEQRSHKYAQLRGEYVG